MNTNVKTEILIINKDFPAKTEVFEKTVDRQPFSFLLNYFLAIIVKICYNVGVEYIYIA